MNRILIGFAFWAGFAMPLSGTSICPAAVACEVSDLPWSTVSQVLEAVTDVRPHSYAQLVDWYQVGRVTVEQVGSSYRVTILDDDGHGDILLISNL